MESIEDRLIELSQRPGLTHGVILDYGSGQQASSQANDGKRLSLRPQEYEEMLHASWVYRRNEHREETMSFTSSVDRGYAWSELSKLSLGNISIIAVIALPVSISELSDGSWYHERMNAGLLATPSRLATHGRSPTAIPRSYMLGISEETQEDKGVLVSTTVTKHTLPEIPVPKASSWKPRLSRRPTINGEGSEGQIHRPISVREVFRDQDGKDIFLEPSQLAEAEEKENRTSGRIHDLQQQTGEISAVDGLLDMSGQDLTTVPIEQADKSARVLILDDNRVTSLASLLSHLVNIEVLQLRRNGLQHFPRDVIAHPSLVALDLSHNFIEEIPTELAEMSQLRELAVEGNPLQELPAAVWQMQGLERLSMNWTVWREWSAMRKAELIAWEVVDRHGVGLYALGWVELVRRQL